MCEVSSDPGSAAELGLAGGGLGGQPPPLGHTVAQHTAHHYHHTTTLRGTLGQCNTGVFKTLRSTHKDIIVGHYLDLISQMYRAHCAAHFGTQSHHG